jgi:post-segregation antitoxin (ccd killing protein)
MPTLKVSLSSMALLMKEARDRDITVKDVADTLISEALEEDEAEEDLEEED